MHFETIAVRAGGGVDETTGAIAPPIHLSTTFERNAEGQPRAEFSYVREGNPTQVRLEDALAALDSGAASLVFASGMAAGVALLQSLPVGAHVILPDDGYYTFRQVAEQYLAHWGLSYDLVAMDDLDAVRAALRPNTHLVWAESPSNPLLKVVDLSGLSALAHRAGALLCVDNTFATPALQRPLRLGADVVLHSTTKYLGGHSDVQGGCLIFRERSAWLESIVHLRGLTGGVAAPFNSWLILRGIRTLPVRMRVHCENAKMVAEFLIQHPKVQSVHYPGLPSHPGHAIAARQMSDYGGMLSFQVEGGREEALIVSARTELFVRATSLGGIESLIEHRASSEGPGSSTPLNLLRLSVGLEHPRDLVEDLAAALG